MSGFGTFLVENGLISRQDLRQALNEQLKGMKPLGRLAVEEGCLSESQVQELRETQKEDGRLLGDLALDRAWISRDELGRLIAMQQSRRRRLGEILLDLDMISEEEMRRALAEYEAISEVRRRAVRTLLEEMPRGRLIEKLIDYAGRHLERAVGQPFSLALFDVDPRCRGLLAVADSFAVVQKLTGSGGLAFAFILDREWMYYIASRMLEFAVPPDQEMIEDTVRELVNLIAGNALSALGPDAVGLHSEPPEILPVSELKCGDGGCVFLDFLGPRGVVVGLILLGEGTVGAVEDE